MGSRRARGIAALVTLLTAFLATVGCRAGYVVKSAYFQMELLASRRPVDKVVNAGKLSKEELAALDIVAKA